MGFSVHSSTSVRSFPSPSSPVQLLLSGAWFFVRFILDVLSEETRGAANKGDRFVSKSKAARRPRERKKYIYNSLLFVSLSLSLFLFFFYFSFFAVAIALGRTANNDCSSS